MTMREKFDQMSLEWDLWQAARTRVDTWHDKESRDIARHHHAEWFRLFQELDEETHGKLGDYLVTSNHFSAACGNI